MKRDTLELLITLALRIALNLLETEFPDKDQEITDEQLKQLYLKFSAREEYERIRKREKRE